MSENRTNISVSKIEENGDAGTDAIERLAAAISEHEALEFMLRQRLAAVIAERDEMKIRMHLCMAAAIVNAVVLFITTFAF